MTNKEVDDPLKQLSEILKPDSRQASYLLTLDQRHAALAALELHPGVPVEVRQLFETAKNLSLYSWYVYRFHQVAELIACAALEMALRVRLGHHPISTDLKAPSLRRLLQTAVARGWISDDKFPSLRGWVTEQIQCLKLRNVPSGTPYDLAEKIARPTEAEISAAVASAKFSEGLAARLPNVRNALAHGSATLHPNSYQTLWIISETIAQLFEPPAKVARAKAPPGD